MKGSQTVTPKSRTPPPADHTEIMKTAKQAVRFSVQKSAAVACLENVKTRYDTALERDDHARQEMKAAAATAIASAAAHAVYVTAWTLIETGGLSTENDILEVKEVAERAISEFDYSYAHPGDPSTPFKASDPSKGFQAGMPSARGLPPMALAQTPPVPSVPPPVPSVPPPVPSVPSVPSVRKPKRRLWQNPNANPQ